MSKVSYNNDVARTASAGLQSTASQLEASLADLNAFVNAACANWEGDEAVQYRNLQAQWDKAAGEIHSILNQIRSSLDKNTDSVEAMRSQVRNTLAG